MPLKGREYEERIQSIGFEKATAWATRELIERHNSLEKTLGDCGNELMALMQAVEMLAVGTTAVRARIEEIARRDKINEDHPTPSDGFN